MKGIKYFYSENVNYYKYKNISNEKYNKGKYSLKKFGK